MERNPKIFITDSAFNYKTAFYKEYRTRTVKNWPKCVRHIRFWGDNNEMEGLNVRLETGKRPRGELRT
ncbi:MAG: hypothetical protein KGH87_05545 [Thaumarchaeota archaeon]|nr:hypothetical protein [Nitrososphaerota archaeon]MDE1839369.1 hypothetical protein [Nitrososphaerota archaeon]